MKKCLILFAIVTVLSLFTTNDAHAFGRRGKVFFRGSCSTPCYTPCYAPVIETPVVVLPVLAYPVLVPAYQFQYVPQAYATTIPVVPVTGYPVAFPIIQAPTSYGQPVNYGQIYNQPVQQNNFGLNNKDRIRELARALLEEMSKASEESNTDNGPPAVPNQTLLPQSQLTQQVAMSVMARTCAQCHTGVGSKGDLTIFTQPGLFNQHVNWKRIKDEVAHGKMPPKDSNFQISFDEKQAIVHWLQSIGVN